MTGVGHRMTGLGAGFFAAAIGRAAGFSLELELITGIIAAFSTTLPDWLEMPIIRNGQRVGSLIPHRTITHWGLLWLLLMGWGAYTGNVPGAMSLGAATGALIHLLGDAPNSMGVPWLWPTHRLRLGRGGWWRSGQYEPFLICFFTVFGVSTWLAVHTYLS